MLLLLSSVEVNINMPSYSWVGQDGLQQKTEVARALGTLCPYAQACQGAYVTDNRMLASDTLDLITLDSSGSIHCSGVKYRFGSDPQVSVRQCISADQDTVSRGAFKGKQTVESLARHNVAMCPIYLLLTAGKDAVNQIGNPNPPSEETA